MAYSNTNTYGDMKTLSVADILSGFYDEIDFETERTKSDKTGYAKDSIRKMEIAIQILANIPDDVTFRVEEVKNTLDRPFFLANTGSVIECALKYYMQGGKVKHLAKSELYCSDFEQGWYNPEIKCALTPKSKPTPSHPESTILVNALGVWRIGKNEVMTYTNSQGRLPANRPCGRYDSKLSELMGFEPIGGEEA